MLVAITYPSLQLPLCEASSPLHVHLPFILSEKGGHLESPRSLSQQKGMYNSHLPFILMLATITCSFL